ncbi:hypothetical protein RND81_11G224400 [Saponaria officinalis]|uniref:SOSEKI DIX-like domain-containing protein n=1 Tax=Saponaria officinalis TaxID=3572 RepID=A0AAW1HQY0_SAPOF
MFCSLKFYYTLLLIFTVHVIMDVLKEGRSIEKLDRNNGTVDHNDVGRLPFYQHQHQHPHPKNRIVKMFNKVQVVYYLTRNGHLEHPHYIEVSHLVTQPLRLKDVIERLTLLRGKALPCQYSWSCKRSYKNGYVWNDLTENDAIYAADGSEYVLKGSELIQDRDFTEIRLQEVENRGRKQSKTNTNATISDTNGSLQNKPQQRHSFRQASTTHVEQHHDSTLEQCGASDEFETEEDENRVSCNSSNALYTKPIEQEESYSLPSTSSTISDKLAQPDKPPNLTSGVVIEEDGDPYTTSLTRNPVLLQLIGCGAKAYKAKAKASGKSGNYNMWNTTIPCLKQQLSSREERVMSNTYRTTCECKMEKSKVQLDDAEKNVVVDDDQDMIMVRYMSENPRFWNLQSQEKEYFSGTIVETMTRHHTQSSGYDSGFGQGQSQGQSQGQGQGHPVFVKSSSYNELRSAKAGLEAVASKAMDEDEDEDVKVKGIIKLCLPRKKTCPSNSTTKSNKL